MATQGGVRGVPEVEGRRGYGRAGGIASREPLASSMRDYAEAAAAPFGRGQALDDVRERAGDFTEWRMDYSRQLAR